MLAEKPILNLQSLKNQKLLPRIRDVKIRHSRETIPKFAMIVSLGIFMTAFGFHASVSNANENYDDYGPPNSFPNPTNAKILVQVELVMQTMLGILLILSALSRLAVLFMSWIGLNIISMIITMSLHFIYENPIGLPWQIALVWACAHFLQLQIVKQYIDVGLMKFLEDFESSNETPQEIEMV